MVNTPAGSESAEADVIEAAVEFTPFVGDRRSEPAPLGLRGVLRPRKGMGLDQILHRAAQERLAAEGHTQGLDLPRIDLVLRPAVEVRDLARAPGQLLGNPSHLLLGDVRVTRQVVEYSRLRSGKKTRGAAVPLELPQRTLSTVAVAWTIPNECLVHTQPHSEPLSCRLFSA